MFRNFSFLIIMTFVSSVASAWTLKVSGQPQVGYEISSANSLWSLEGPGRKKTSWTPKPCADQIWIDFEKLLLNKIETLPLRWAKAPANASPTYNVEYKNQKFVVSSTSALGEFLQSLPDEVVLTRTEEEMHCRRGAK